MAVNPATYTYTLSAYIKTENMAAADGACISLLQFDANGSVIGWYTINGSNKLIKSGGTTDWIRGSVLLNNFASGTAQVVVYLYNTDLSSTAYAYFDEVLLFQN